MSRQVLIGPADDPLQEREPSSMVVKSAIDRLGYYDWTFSNTAEYAIAALLVIVLVVMMLVIFWGS